MKVKLLFFISALTIVLGLFSCKKDKTDNGVNGKFQGLWVESSEKKVSLVVSSDTGTDPSQFNMQLIVGSTGYPFVYKFNAAGDTVYFSSAEGMNLPYKITFSNSNKTISIKKFHSALPNVDPVVFNKSN